jgi:NAD(P)-dependent dehydrogenase (short-subunit alcohol dehydrogenase family)
MVQDRRRRGMLIGTVAALVMAAGGVFALTAAPGYRQAEQGAILPASAQEPVAGSSAPIILITGSTDGLGREVALRLADTGAHIIVHGRNRERGEAVVAEIESRGTGGARFYAADFGSIDEVRRLGNEILRDYDRIDVLVNNAGIYRTAPGAQREVSADGHELHFAVNYLSGYLLTRMLLPLLQEAAPSRIVNVASTAQTPIDFGDVMLEREYSGGRAYGQSKLAQILFTVDLAGELEGTGVSVNALHPATLMNTSMVLSVGREPMSTVEEGADALMNLVTGAGPGSGEYYNGLRLARPNDQAYDAGARARLRRLSDTLVGRE